jgi:hypothetical protein
MNMGSFIALLPSNWIWTRQGHQALSIRDAGSRGSCAHPPLPDAIAGVVVEPVVAARGEPVVEPDAAATVDPVAVVSMVPVAAATVGRAAVVSMEPVAAVSMDPDVVVPMDPVAVVSMDPDVVVPMDPVAVVSMVPDAAVSMVPDADRACRQVSREVSPVSPEASPGAGEFQRFLADYKGCCRGARRISVDVFQVGLAPAGLAPVFQVDASEAAVATDTRPGQTIRQHDSRTKIPDGNPVHTPASSPPNRIPNAT